MPCVESGYIETKVESSGADEQIFERYRVANRGLFAFNGSRELRDFERDRMDDQISHYPFEEDTATAAISFYSCSR